MVVSELVTHAVAAAPWAPVYVALLPDSGRIVLEVWDKSPRHPVKKSPDYMAENGRGLHIVEKLSSPAAPTKRAAGRWSGR